jgi:thioredoxin-dependent peroxiredoxin
VPSIDTPVCSLEVKKLDSEIAKAKPELSVLVVSRDLPFAQARWCGAEGTKTVKTLSDYKYREFGEAFGCAWNDAGLLARAVFLSDSSGKVTYVEYVGDISSEPDYDTLTMGPLEVLTLICDKLCAQIDPELSYYPRALYLAVTS